jgi:hypothetical protein
MIRLFLFGVCFMETRLQEIVDCDSKHSSNFLEFLRNVTTVSGYLYPSSCAKKRQGDIFSLFCFKTSEKHICPSPPFFLLWMVPNLEKRRIVSGSRS